MELKNKCRLVLVFGLFLFSIAQADETQQKYPPYPDVWDWQLSTEESNSVTKFKMENGDILINDLTGESPPYKRTDIGFFSGKHYSQKVVDKFFSDKTLKFFPAPSLDSWQAVLPNGKVAKFEPSYRGPCSNEYGLYSDLSIKDTTSEIRKVVVILLKQPYRLNIQCGDEDSPPDERPFSFNTNVFIPDIEDLGALDDNTFLVTINGITNDNYSLLLSIVMRFDDQLNSRSSLIGKKIFLIDRDEFDKFIADFDEKWKTSGHPYDSRFLQIDDYYVALFEQMRIWLSQKAQ